MIISNGRKRYGVDLDKLAEARSLLNKEFVLNPQTDGIVQPYDTTEPQGFTLWKEEYDADNNRHRKRKSRYRIYKEIDHENFLGQVLSQSMYKPRNYRMGSLNDPKSRISRIWQAIEQAVRRNPHATFTLQNIQDIERKAVGNNRQAGKIGLIILKELGWIRVVGVSGVSTIYAIAQDDAKRPSIMDDYIYESMEHIYNVSDDLADIDPEPDSYPESREEKDRHDSSADGS